LKNKYNSKKENVEERVIVAGSKTLAPEEREAGADRRTEAGDQGGIRFIRH
jgi:hypothetical protein